ncbi:MAG: nitrate reductase cytochrome c-type subunit [Stappiaceae bacterium]
MRILTAVLIVFATMNFTASAADSPITTLRDAPLDQTSTPPRMTPQSNTDLRKARNYPEQPPIIPHKTEDYQVDIRANQCLNCHSRRAVEDSQAPMVSITHFMDRDGQFLATISPRRYFCNQCHVSQHDIKLQVENTFVDSHDLIEFLQQKK